MKKKKKKNNDNTENLKSRVDEISRVETKVYMSPVGIGIAIERGPLLTFTVYFWLGKSDSESLDTFCPRIT